MDNFNSSTLAQYFANEDAARDLLEGIRWPDSPVCPHCGSLSIYKLTPKPDSKKPVRLGVYKCGDCRKQFTVTVGTIFESSRIPLHKWLMAICLMCSRKKGMSAHQLHRMLNLTYKSAWFMAHRIRLAMKEGPLADKLNGIIEADETYVGGKHLGGKRGRGSENKTPVVALIARGGQLRAKKVEQVTAKNLKEYIRENVQQEARIMTDEFVSYQGLGREFASHEVVAHSKKEYARGQVHVNTVEGWFSLLKRGMVGTFHHVSPQYLDHYVDKFGFRYNNRKVDDGQRAILAIRGAKGKRLVYRDTIGSTKELGKGSE